jgi:hypothetical protein
MRRTLPVEFSAYIADMLWARTYALENRELMLNAALDDLFTQTLARPAGEGVV